MTVSFLAVFHVKGTRSGCHLLFTLINLNWLTSSHLTLCLKRDPLVEEWREPNGECTTYRDQNVTCEARIPCKFVVSVRPAKIRRDTRPPEIDRNLKLSGHEVSFVSC